MEESSQLTEFSNNLLQEVFSASDDEDSADFRINAFTSLFAGYLVDAGEIEDSVVCYHKSRGIQLNGYGISQDEDCLDLFISIFEQQCPPVSVGKTQVETAFRQAEAALKKALAGFHPNLEESSEQFDMFQRIHELRSQLTRCRVFLLTDGIVNTASTPDNVAEGDIQVSFHLWDIVRLHRLQISGQRFETIEIDFEMEFGCTIPCLPMMDEKSDYEGYLAVIPGSVLAGVYGKYGPRLLERNVRSFLQARGNVNKGIRKTILEEPHRFFAYNNGISATADEIVFSDKTEGGRRIRKVRNLQIVNGGQTTASLHHAVKKDKADVTGIFVQAKLSVIPPAQMDTIVPLISRYANSQNKVNEADFFANDPYHIRLEELSRNIWAPAADGANKQSKWFYERARGQYVDAKNREGTFAKRRQFESLCPPSQKFSKTDLAKYENTWMQLPWLVSMGAQKNFIHFSIRLAQNEKIEVDMDYFQHLVGKAILFKCAEKLIARKNFGGYRANIVTYTIAYLSHKSSQKINLDSIWRRQAVLEPIQLAISEVSEKVHSTITNPPNGKNVTEWCKKKDCWDSICSLDYPLSSAFRKALSAGESGKPA